MFQAVPPITRSSNCIYSIWYMSSLLTNSPKLAAAASKLDIHQMLYIQFELLMMGGKTA
jgi:23S rRNA A2030 N6-methylase RlmJ